ncbi:MAG: hypothetical protein QF903_09315 [Planctomycetota bacterium]|jgi:heme/copper-type cytochrome/quinol oxidase subunit 1|nr:hypothetical protein [Planctomycetota bacterium]MDP6763504.1 hypothetical protein [Planctomycetota bacterium]MDP6989664.1 hypothetical protein [Planctomycetota bacterium]
MPPLVRRYLRTSLGALVLGVLTGLHMSSAKYLGAGTTHWPYVVAHTHLLLIGFVLLGSMGIAIWKLPPAHSASAHRPWIDSLSYWLITLSTLTRFTLEVSLGYTPANELYQVGIFATSCVQTATILLFVWNCLPRLRAAEEDRSTRSV